MHFWNFLDLKLIQRQVPAPHWYLVKWD